MSVNNVKKTKIGAKNPYWAPIVSEPDNSLPTYGTAMRVSELVKVTEALSVAEGSFYSDDHLSDNLTEFKYCGLTFDNKGLTDDICTAMLGCDYTGGVLTHGGNDNPPYGGFAFSRSLIDDGVKYYEGIHYPRVKAALGNETYDTKGESASLSGDSLPFKAYKAKDALESWKRRKVFTTANEADLWAQTQLGYATAYLINISKSGTGTVSPIGNKMVASAGSLEITVGTPTKVYDNGADVTISVADGKYTLSNVSANHDIVIVYTA